MKTKLLVLLLALAMLITAFASCTTKKVKPQTPNNNNNQQQNNQTPGDEEETEETIQPPSFGSAVFDIETVRVMERDGCWKEEWDPEAESNPVLEEALVEKVGYLTEKYDFELEVLRVHVDNTAKTLGNSILAKNGAYDFITFPSMHTNTLAVKGYFHILQEIDYIDLTQPWWHQKLNTAIEYKGSNFYAVGSSNLCSMWVASGVFFNKDIAEKRGYSISDIYDMVMDHTWTIEKMVELATDVYVDDGDEQPSENDIFGITQANGWYPAFYGTGLSFTEKDADGKFVAAPINESIIDTLTTIINYENNEKMSVPADEHPTAGSIDEWRQFTDGKALFLVEGIQVSDRARRSETEYGILPSPLLAEGQAEYYSAIHQGHNSSVAIPVDARFPEQIGILIEESNYISRVEVWPAFYDILLKGQVARDPESAEILDIIFENLTLDPAMLYSTAYDHAIRRMIRENKPNEVKSTLEGLVASTQNSFNITMEAFDAVLAGTLKPTDGDFN